MFLTATGTSPWFDKPDKRSEELKNFMRNHADEIRKFRSIDNSRSITYSHAISYLMHRNTMK